MKDFSGQYIWIMGASSGIGAGLAKELAARGAVLALSARRKEALEALRAELDGEGHLVVPADAGDFKSTKAAFDAVQEQFPKIDRALFMAAVFTPHDGEKKSIDAIHDALTVNLGGAFHMLDPLVPYFESQGSGQIALCASVAGYRGLPTGQPYCCTKAALINLAESLKLDLEKKNIDVKVINPGFVKTPLTDKNDFKMPMIIEVPAAAKAIANDLLTQKFEIHFPKKFTYLMKLIKILPNWLYFIMMRRVRW